MKIQESYLPDDITINTDGTIKTTKDRQKEHIQASYGEKEPIPQAHPAHIQKFDAFLEEYQEDINKIVGKHRGVNHLLSHEEVISEVNLSFIKKRDELIFHFGADFEQTNFRKLAFSFVRNVCRWSYGKLAKNNYVKRRQDNTFYTEDGPKTTFEHAVDRIGEEESFYENFDRNEKCQFLMKMIKEYTGILTDAEIKVLSMMEKGMNQYEMSEETGVTRQAISVMSIKIFEKIRAHFTVDVIHDNSYEAVSKGYESIKNFFSLTHGYIPMQDKDKPILKKFLLANAKLYRAPEMSTKFLKGKYSKQQILSFAVKNRLGFCLVKAKPDPLSQSQCDSILQLAKEGKTTHQIASILKLPIHRVSGKRGFFVRQGLIPRVPTWKRSGVKKPSSDS